MSSRMCLLFYWLFLFAGLFNCLYGERVCVRRRTIFYTAAEKKLWCSLTHCLLSRELLELRLCACVCVCEHDTLWGKHSSSSNVEAHTERVRKQRISFFFLFYFVLCSFRLGRSTRHALHGSVSFALTTTLCKPARNVRFESMCVFHSLSRKAMPVWFGSISAHRRSFFFQLVKPVIDVL